MDGAKDMWRDDLRRRVQHYGWLYDYKARSITSDMHVGPLPDWLAKLAKRLYEETGLSRWYRSKLSSTNMSQVIHTH